MGLEALSEGIIDGVAGVFEQPVRGALDGGAAGFARGAGRGLVGVVAKPLSGLAGLASKTTEGIASDARLMTPGRRSLQQQVRRPSCSSPSFFSTPRGSIAHGTVGLSRRLHRLRVRSH